jgi:hypothetical protein
MSDLIGRDGIWDLLPKEVSDAVKSYCNKNGFFGEWGHVSYIYGEVAQVAINALHKVEAKPND